MPTVVDPENNIRLNNPPSLGQWRERLFRLDVPIEMRKEEFETYFPYVSNCWTRQGSEKKRKDNSLVYRYACLLSRKQHVPENPQVSTMNVKNGKKRMTSVRKGETCQATMRVVCLDNSVFIERRPDKNGDIVGHTHDIDLCDSIHRNNGLRKAVDGGIVRNEAPSDILAGLQGLSKSVLCSSTYMLTL